MANVTEKKADLVLVRGNSPLDWAIEKISDSVYSHVAGVVKQHELFEANGFRKVGYEAMDDYAGCSDVYTCDLLTDEQRDGIVKWVISKKGDGYDYELIAWEAVHYALHFDLPYHEHGRYDCSQLWLDAYRSVGVDLCPGLEYASPGDLSKSKLLRMTGSF